MMSASDAMSKKRVIESKRSPLLWFACVAVALSVLTAGLSAPVTAHNDESAEGTIAALQTEVADLRAQITALTTVTVTAPDQTGTPVTEQPSPLSGDGLPLLPAGTPGAVDVIAIGAPVRGSVPIAVRNNTGEAVLLRGVLGIARDANDTLAFSASVSTFAPFLLQSGQVAVGTVYFGPNDLPDGLTLEFEPETSPAGGGRAYRQDLEIIEGTRTPEGVVGIARNGTSEPLNGPFSVIGLCLDQPGAIQGYYAAHAAKDSLAPGETTPFTATFYGTGPCDAYLLGVNGFKES